MNDTMRFDREIAARRLVSIGAYRTELFAATELGIAELRRALHRVPARLRPTGWRLALGGHAPAYPQRHRPTVGVSLIKGCDELTAKERDALAAVKAAAVHLDALLRSRRLFAALLEAELGLVGTASPGNRRDHRGDELEDLALRVFIDSRDAGRDEDEDEVRARVAADTGEWGVGVYELTEGGVAVAECDVGANLPGETAVGGH